MTLIYDYETAFANNGELSWLLYKQNVNKDVYQYLFKENRKLDFSFVFFYCVLPNHRQADSDSLSP